MIAPYPEFEDATQMFYSTRYEEGLNLINKCIENDPNNSILYSNRALFYSQMDLIEPALIDLNIAIQLNYLNYIAYFNLFSLEMRCENIDRAFENLCCSLSCLYLIRGKTRKNELDASKAIKYAQNNMQAHLLKGLIHLQNGKYKLALNQLDWASEINPSNLVIKSIRKVIFQKMNPGLTLSLQQYQAEESISKNTNFRLECSYNCQDQDKQMEIKGKVIEFNELYNNLNEYSGTVTTKVPKTEEMNESDIPQQSRQFSFETNVKQDALDNLYEHYKPINQSKQTQAQDISIRLTQKNDQKILNDSLQRQLKSGHQQKQFLDSQSQYPKNTSQVQVDEGICTPIGRSYLPELGYYEADEERSSTNQMKSEEFTSINHKKRNDEFVEFQSMIQSCQGENQMDDSFCSIISNQHEQLASQISMISNSLYPIIENSMLQISILKVEFIDKSTEEINNMKDIYCIANYCTSNQSNFKLRTACQKGFENGTQWNEKFDAIEIPPIPQCMKIKVYNKKYSSYRDDLIGQIQVEISSHGFVKLPLYNKKAEISGNLLMNLELVFKEIKQVNEANEEDEN